MTRSRRIPTPTTPTASPTAPAPSLSICRCYRYKILWVLCGSFIAGYCFYQQLHPIGSLLVQRGIMAQQVKPSSSSSSRGGGPTNTTINTNSDDNGDNDDVYVVADPTLLKRKRREFLLDDNVNNNNNDDYSSSSSNFFKTLQGYYPFIIDNNNENDNENNMQSAAAPEAVVCNMTGGYGLEDSGGWELLTKKVRVYNNLPDDEEQDDERIMAGEKEKQLQLQFPRILCMIYTHYPMRHLARTAALSYGYKCDGFLAFTSNETIPELGFVALKHDGIESYHNMWQKVRSIWNYVGTHYLDKYDYFHLGGDDMYVIPNNLKRFLSMAEEREREKQQNETYPNPPAAFYYGQWVRQKAGPIVAGGPGYTLNNVAVKLFVRDALPTCFKDKVASYEDKLMSLCLRSVLHIGPSDTRDYNTGEQMYHDVPPHQVYVSRPPPPATTNNSTGRRSRKRRPTFHSRGQAYWEKLPYPNSTFVSNNNDKKNITSAAAEGGGASVVVGPKYGLDAAATYSVSFHNLYKPLYMARIHAILYPGTCPKTTTTSPSLGQSLQQQLLIQRNQQQQENQNEEEHQQQ